MSTTTHAAPAGQGKRPPCSTDSPAGATAARKAKRSAKPVGPLYGWRHLDGITRRGLAEARAVQGLAGGLHDLFALRLAEAEEDLSRLGKSTDGDLGSRYSQQMRHTEDLRTWVSVLAALKERARRAESAADEAAERVGYAVRRGGAQ